MQNYLSFSTLSSGLVTETAVLGLGVVADGLGDLSVPYPRVWSRKPEAGGPSLRCSTSAFSTLSSGLVTETAACPARALQWRA